jgi:hypothetical protein
MPRLASASSCRATAAAEYVRGTAYGVTHARHRAHTPTVTSDRRPSPAPPAFN